jgi:molecular chaperone DnaK (HSP70)
MLCPNCEQWEITQADNFCSWCRHKFVRLAAGLSCSDFLVQEISPLLELTIRNLSEGGARIETLEFSHDWIRRADTRVPLPFDLAAGGTLKLPLEVRTLDLPDASFQGSVSVVSSIGTERLEFFVGPPPDLEIEVRDAVLYVDGPGTSVTRGCLRVQNGELLLERISLDPPISGRVTTEASDRLPLRLRKGDALPIRAELNLSEIDVQELPSQHAIRLVAEGGDMRWEQSFNASCCRAPRLTIWEEKEPLFRLMEGRPGRVTLTLQNAAPESAADPAGNGPLEIRAIAISTPDGGHAEWIRPAGHEFPLVLHGGEKQTLPFECDPVPPPGRYNVLFRLETNLEEPQRLVGLEIVVERAAAFEGILAIDFGTSNTCCAVIGDFDTQPRMVPVVSAAGARTTVPSMAQYLRLNADGTKEIRIGSIQALLDTYDRVASTVRPPKRDIGSDADRDRIEIRYAEPPHQLVRYTPREVVADYLEKLRVAAENYGRCTFERLVITHPARFSLRQIRNLIAAVRDAFGAECEVTTLQEPVAAALNYIVSEQALRTGKYVLGVVDFGGGTTDITVIEVENRRVDGQVNVYPHLAGSTGKWFGGDDLTRFVLERALERCNEVATDFFPDGRVLIDPATSADAELRAHAALNRARLQRWAEEVKLHLFSGPSAALPAVLTEPLRLAVFHDSGADERPFDFSQVAPVLGELNQYLSEELERFDAMLRHLLQTSGRGQLDVVYLSGKSSAIPLVREFFGSRYSSTLLAPEPKECVVRGACLYQKLLHSIDLALHVEGEGALKTTTSRLGIQSTGPGGESVFKEVFGLGVRIPCSGLKAKLPHFRLSSRSRIRLLENASPDQDLLEIGGAENRDVSEIGTYVLKQSPSSLGKTPVEAELEFTVMEDLELKVVARIEGCPDPLPFVPVHESESGKI